MAVVLPFSEPELRLLGALLRNKVRFLVVGLSAAALQGAPVVTQDIDLWFEDLSDPKLAAALRKIGAAYVPPFNLNPPMLAGPGTQPFDVVLRMDGLDDFRTEYRRAIEVRIGKLRLKVLPLSRIITSKQAANRPKDRLVIPLLRDALAAQSILPKHRTKQRKSTMRSGAPVQNSRAR